MMDPKTELRRIQIDGRELSYEWKRGGVKNINLRVRGDGTVYVSSPHFVSPKTVEEFIREKADFLFRAMEEVKRKHEKSSAVRFREGEKIFLFGEEKLLHFSFDCSGENAEKGEEIIEKDGVLTLFCAEDEDAAHKKLQKYGEKQLETLLFRLISQALPLFDGVKFPEIRLRAMRRTWGNCRAGSGILTFNSRLACYPVSCIEYVVMHELSHFLVQDHSAAFYAVLSQRMPDWKARKTLLNTISVIPFF